MTYPDRVKDSVFTIEEAMDMKKIHTSWNFQLARQLAQVPHSWPMLTAQSSRQQPFRLEIPEIAIRDR